MSSFISAVVAALFVALSSLSVFAATPDCVAQISSAFRVEEFPQTTHFMNDLLSKMLHVAVIVRMLQAADGGSKDTWGGNDPEWQASVKLVDNNFQELEQDSGQLVRIDWKAATSRICETLSDEEQGQIIAFFANDEAAVARHTIDVSLALVMLTKMTSNISSLASYGSFLVPPEFRSTRADLIRAASDDRSGGGVDLKATMKLLSSPEFSAFSAMLNDDKDSKKLHEVFYKAGAEAVSSSKIQLIALSLVGLNGDIKSQFEQYQKRVAATKKAESGGDH